MRSRIYQFTGRSGHGRRGGRRRAAAVAALACLALAALAAQSCRRTGAGFAREYVPMQPTPTPAPAPAATPTPAPPPAPAASQSAVPATGGDETRPGNPAAWGEDARALVGRTFAPIYFEFDSAELDSIARRQLAEYAQWLREHPNVWLTLEGHTDSTGSVRYNYNLGMARALAVEDYLRGAGVGADRMFCISYGEERPAVTGADPQSMALNRRTEVLGFVAPLGVEKPAPVAVTGGAAPQAAPAPAPPLAQDIPREPGR